ncbi:beta-ketoacyl-[acyl-carrier-protein] synthase family protein [Nocardia africana]|uniref:3-oxoacyl-[acyl-carrier-protein] synthase 2 n=1 Tax=Nocardia africana TaxID=134964 RepID=A0A378WWS0_9NOCA|nr:beta-ketoacyl-[acyl-carrier-protein] synthase family protein [Nocardia africana]MCC3312923.1 beta-ketoacyl-[acyl-carrier-protein] synthase family protein [Nocardia africana]SUA45736.1 3-oxoacyl-[acyl-carrier-protein] synthase 2 [Nocardia africana]
MRRRVVITGLGAITSVGIGAGEFLDALRDGRQGAAPITAFDTAGYPKTMGCEVANFAPEQWLGTRAEEFGRATQFAVVAARMALADAGLDGERLRDRRGLVAVGTTDGESRDLDRMMRSWIDDGPDAMVPGLARRIPVSRLSTSIARELTLTDVEAVTIPTACAAGNYAIGYGADAIRCGDVDFALAGGADAVCRKTFSGFYRVGTVAAEHCRPFDADRDGILTGEGGGILVLESLDSAVARGARIYAEILGYGINCDGKHPVAPDLDSFGRCMRLAHEDAGISPGDVDFISAHGTGTRANDVTEAGAIRHVFGDRPPPTTSIKSMIGHTMGAASALAAIACSLAITERFIPPTVNHRHTDPECALDVVPNRARPADLRVVQNNGLAFGGNNAVLILGRHEKRL